MNEESIFATALEKQTAAERQAFLDEACSGNAELRSAVEELLLANSDAGSFMEHPAAGMDATIVSDTSSRDTVDEGKLSVGMPFLTRCDKPDRLGLLDQYEVMEIVGHGGMGVVLRAFDTKLSRVVAVKVMSPTLATNPTAVKRFLREATTAAAIHHDHVVTIHAVNDAHVPPYLVMQFVEGQTLQQKVDREGALQLKHILRIGSQVAAGLAAAHKLGVTHRDIKPANILLENGVERVKISDFGLARAADDAQMTQTGIIAGTPQYMSPEQAKGEPIDARSDLFSLGSVLYTMCTGRPAFRADNPVAVLRRVCDDTPRPIHEINAKIPSWLEAIVNKLLAKDPTDRFQTAAEVADLLSQYLAHVQNPTIAPRPPEIVLKRSATAPSSANPPRRTTQTALLATAIAILLLVGLSLSEAAGVTNLAATVIRIVTNEGTLVIETDDPSIKVTADEKEVTIQATGVGEVHLRPGSYKLAATKDGQPVPVNQELVTISRGGKQVVRIALEPSAEAPDGAKSTPVVWQPPEKPDPYKILQEAQADATARQFELALAKHVWYHQHALEYGPSQTGVRLSFALMYWGQLGESYYPAFEKLLQFRDEAATNVKEGKNVTAFFHDLVAINRTLGEDAVTRDVFAFLHAYRPDDAKRVFLIAEPALIQAKAYQLCNTYLDPDQSYRLMTLARQTGIRFAKGNNKSHLRDFVEPHFTNQVTTLVALLVVNGRKAEAEKIAADAKQEWDDAKFHSKLDDALKGNVPEPWPPSPSGVFRVPPRVATASSASPSTTPPAASASTKGSVASASSAQPSIKSVSWQRPDDQDPNEILHEIPGDIKAGRYELAFLKQVWFHENALRYQSGLSGVRLSFALMTWKQLGNAYPPALEKLKAVRDEALENAKNGNQAATAFLEFVSINQVLGDDEITRDAFAWMHQHKPEQARIVYQMCQPALVRLKAYKACDPYLDPEVSVERLTSMFRLNKRLAKDKKYGNSFLDYAEKSFTNGSTTLVALLVANDRQAEAEKVAEQVKKEWDNPEFHADIEKALAGQVPDPWPPRGAYDSASVIATSVTSGVNSTTTTSPEPSSPTPKPDAKE